MDDLIKAVEERKKKIEKRIKLKGFLATKKDHALLQKYDALLIKLYALSKRV